LHLEYALANVSVVDGLGEEIGRADLRRVLFALCKEFLEGLGIAGPPSRRVVGLWSPDTFPARGSNRNWS